MKWLKIGLFVATLLSGVVAAWFGVREVEKNAQRAQKEAVRAQLAEAEADRLLRVRDSLALVTDSVTQRMQEAERRARAARQAIPPRPDPIPGCEACQNRAVALEEALLAEQVAGAHKDTVISVLQQTLHVTNLAADTLRLSLASARAELQRQGAVLTRKKSSVTLGLAAGYGAVATSHGVEHGPGAVFGIQIPVRLPF